MHGRMEVTQSAAATANRIFAEAWDVNEVDSSGGGLLTGGSPRRHRTRSFNGGMSPYSNVGGGAYPPRSVSPALSGLMQGAGGLGLSSDGGYPARPVSPALSGMGGYSSGYAAPGIAPSQSYGGYQGNGYMPSSPSYVPQQTYSDGSAYGYAGSTGSIPSSYAPQREIVVHVPSRSRRHSHSGKHHRTLRSHSPNPSRQYDSYSSGHRNQGYYY